MIFSLHCTQSGKPARLPQQLAEMRNLARQIAIARHYAVE
jgi:hypothetical protein